MPMSLEGSCRCGAISFSVDSHTPYPYQRCYCSICRKSAGGGGYAINIMGLADTLKVKGRRAVRVWNAPIDGQKRSADRHGLISGVAFPYSPPEIDRGPVYEFHLNHLLVPDSPTALFRTEFEEV